MPALALSYLECQARQNPTRRLENRQQIQEDGSRRPLDVSEGDEVLYSKYGGTEITVDGDDLLVLRESDVLAKVD